MGQTNLVAAYDDEVARGIEADGADFENLLAMRRLGSGRRDDSASARAKSAA
ncbi:MAG: hypothetical protein ACLRX5_10725 [Slackia sp.]